MDSALKDLILVGGGGHALSVADSILKNGRYNLIGYTDPVENDSCDLNYLGTDDVLYGLYDKGVKSAFISVGYMGNGMKRDELYSKIRGIGYEIINVVDNTAAVAKKSRFKEGIFVGKNAIINAGAMIEKMSIINSGAIIEHSCVVGEFSHVAVGAILCGNVTVNDHVFVGAGSVIKEGVKIESNAVIGAGSIVLRDVKRYEKCYGVVSD